MIQKTLGLIKPNATKLKLEDDIMHAIDSRSDLLITNKRTLTLTREQAESFYAEHKEKGWFVELIDFMTSGPVIALQIEGESAITSYRSFMGNTDPEQAEKGTLRQIFAENKNENSVHGSDSPEAAERELAFFF